MDTLSEVMNRLNQEGYRGNIHIEDLKLLRPSDWVIDDIFRFEGFTNPSDNSILYAISKKDGSQKTLLVNAYGIDSEEEINSFLDQVTGSEG